MTPQNISWTTPSLSYQTVWDNPFVYKGLTGSGLYLNRHNPDVAHTHVSFTGEYTQDLQREIAKLIMDEADIVKVDGNWRKILGRLLITPESGSGHITVITIPVNPQTTIQPTPTITPSIGVTTTVSWRGKYFGQKKLSVFWKPYRPYFLGSCSF